MDCTLMYNFIEVQWLIMIEINVLKIIIFWKIAEFSNLEISPQASPLII